MTTAEAAERLRFKFIQLVNIRSDRALLHNVS